MSDAVSPVPIPVAVWLFGGGLIGIKGKMPGHFDDPMHQIPGLAVTAFQDLWHCTVGGPADNERRTALPAYGHRSAPIESDPADLLDLRQELAGE
jgi:hypothetical protein